MTLQLATSNVVVLAHHFNPTITDQIWLTRNEILREGEKESGVFSDLLVQVHTSKFDLLIIPEKCQFSPLQATKNNQELVVERVGSLVRTLPHTPYNAIGLNFVWHLIPESVDLKIVTRQMFFDPQRPLCRQFDDPTAKFGMYASKDSLGRRLKLDVKPLVGFRENQDDEIDILQFEVNYHLDIKAEDNAVDRIIETLLLWDKAQDESTQIVNEIVGGVK